MVALSVNSPKDERPIRILQVVWGMYALGGIEAIIMQIMRRLDPRQFKMDFLLQYPARGGYCRELENLGARIFTCPENRWSLNFPREYAQQFKRVLREQGPYDVVHSHVQVFSGLVLRLAYRAGVPIRIAHSHFDIKGRQGLLRSPLKFLLRQWIRRYATHGLASSRSAAAALFGPGWESDSRWQTYFSIFDFSPFQAEVDRKAVREELGLPLQALVVGHVGRFFLEQKNHRFLVKIAAEVAKRQPEMRLLLIGDGPLRPSIEEMAARMGLGDKVIFLGNRLDVPRLMAGAMDVFVLPSLHEGLGLVLVEAQAAGLPCVYSDAVPADVEVIKPLLQRLSLAQPAAAWAEAVLAAREAGRGISRAEALRLMEQSPFQFDAERIEKLYRGN
jgi:glycosyltransferase involved in cell wall biosynthesis